MTDEQKIGARVAIASWVVDRTVEVQQGVSEENLEMFIFGAYIALWAVLFAGDRPDFPQGEGRDARREVEEKLKQLEIEVVKVEANNG